MRVLQTIDVLKAGHFNNVYVEETQSDSPLAHESFVYLHPVSWCGCENVCVGILYSKFLFLHSEL